MKKIFRILIRRLWRLMVHVFPHGRTSPRRTIEFDELSKAYIIRDRESNVCAVLHTQEPPAVDAETAREAAQSYLRTHATLLDLTESELKALEQAPQNVPSESDVDYRFLSEKHQFDVTTVTYQQTCLGLPVWQGAISVHLKRVSNSFKVIAAQARRHRTLTRDRLMTPPDIARHLKLIDEPTLAHQLGIADKITRFDLTSLRVGHQNTMVYRYEAERRAEILDSFDVDEFIMPLPVVPPDIIDGSFNVVSAVYFELKRKDAGSTNWVALIEARTQAVLYLEVFASGVQGTVFLSDPMTTHGGPMPSAGDTALNPRRVWATLPNLIDPQALSGTNVEIVNLEMPGLPVSDFDPPTVLADEDFVFDVRTNFFAAVNAYFNCDRFFGYVESLGFERSNYFPATPFPVKVDHRGTPQRDGPRGTSAECRGITAPGPNGTTAEWGIKNVIFCLAEADTPPWIGNASDWRVVLHELGGHGTLLNHVGSTKFLFAHSAGDSLAAILNDPESNAPDKGRTYPWVRYPRWHNRDASKGWAWDGQRDNDDYDMDQEQILSTTHFNLYGAIGGCNTTQVDKRWFAADFTVFLILRAIQTLSHPMNPAHASDWLSSLVVADACDWTSRGHSGGAYGKVIHWAFQKQGLFTDAALVDVYIDDGRDGDYRYQSDHTNCMAIWNRVEADGLDEHQQPLADVPNFAYVKVKTRGSMTAKSVVVSAFQNLPQSALVYPDDWQPMAPPQSPPTDLPPNSAAVTFGPFTWTPSDSDNSILMSVSANGDASNLAKFGNGKSIPDWRLVPHDNNIAMRKV